MKLLFFVLACQISLAHNPFWASLDKKLITKISEIDKNNPHEVERYFLKAHKIKKANKKNLGFGWKIWEAGIGGGYISIGAKIYYYKDSIVSYSISPELPEEKGLLNKYKDWYKKAFEFDEKKILPFIFQEKNILRPLNQLSDSLEILNIPPRLVEYMSPKSGLTYGHSGGYSGKMLPNRKFFHEIKSELNKDHIILAMYSINPASRFTAIETYLRNQDKYAPSKEIENWIEQNFEEIPKVMTLMGCIGEYWDSKTLVYFYARLEMN